MNYVIAVWLVLSASIIYWNVTRLNDSEPLSDCHKAPIKVYHDKPMCTECKMFCEVLK